MPPVNIGMKTGKGNRLDVLFYQIMNFIKQARIQCCRKQGRRNGLYQGGSAKETGVLLKYVSL